MDVGSIKVAIKSSSVSVEDVRKVMKVSRLRNAVLIYSLTTVPFNVLHTRSAVLLLSLRLPELLAALELAWLPRCP